MRLTKRILYKEYVKNRKNPMSEKNFIERLNRGFTYGQLLVMEKQDRTTMPRSEAIYRRYLTNK